MRKILFQYEIVISGKRRLVNILREYLDKKTEVPIPEEKIQEIFSKFQTMAEDKKGVSGPLIEFFQNGKYHYTMVSSEENVLIKMLDTFIKIKNFNRRERLMVFSIGINMLPKYINNSVYCEKLKEFTKIQYKNDHGKILHLNIAIEKARHEAEEANLQKSLHRRIK
ncbi:MAG: hypothetical protein V4439_04030 [Patescibacteria group bacterium]